MDDLVSSRRHPIETHFQVYTRRSISNDDWTTQAFERLEADTQDISVYFVDEVFASRSPGRLVTLFLGQIENLVAPWKDVQRDRPQVRSKHPLGAEGRGTGPVSPLWLPLPRTPDPHCVGLRMKSSPPRRSVGPVDVKRLQELRFA